MPHLVLEYSSNIQEKDGFGHLFLKSHQVLVKTALASLESCKSRAVEQQKFYIGDGDTKNAFVHLEIRLAEGRSIQTRELVGKKTLGILAQYFSKSMKNFCLQITVEVTEFPQNFYFKIPADFQNSLDRRRRLSN